MFEIDWVGGMGASDILVIVLIAQSRQHGVERVEDVAAAYLEGDGRVSVILRGKRLRA